MRKVLDSNLDRDTGNPGWSFSCSLPNPFQFITNLLSYHSMLTVLATESVELPSSRPAVVPIQSPAKRVRGVKRPRREADHLKIVQFLIKENFTFTFYTKRSAKLYTYISLLHGGRKKVLFQIVMKIRRSNISELLWKGSRVIQLIFLKYPFLSSFTAGHLTPRILQIRAIYYVCACLCATIMRQTGREAYQSFPPKMFRWHVQSGQYSIETSIPPVTPTRCLCPPDHTRLSLNLFDSIIVQVCLFISRILQGKIVT
jgi:hypothetical protein